MERREKVAALERQGVRIPAPESIEIGDEVKLEQVRGPGTVLHAGTKLYGEDLLILPGARIGYEEPATVESCAVGREVKLNGGYYAGAVFLDKVVLGKGAQVRAGTLLEEEANGAHCVGLKQTILFPYVTLGSLINFCDVLMAGGSSRKDHSEVGSSFIHFNYTPFGRHGDKATPSICGDVPRGVMLRERRIFLGGQGGLVGPMTIEYGTVLAAGTVYRRDYGPDVLVVGEHLPARSLPFTPLRYGRVRSKVQKNLRYLGNLAALWHWYGEVRLRLAGSDADLATLYRRGQATIAEGIEERIARLGQVAGYMEDSIAELQKEEGKARELAEQRAFAASWGECEAALRGYPQWAQRESERYASFRAGLDRAAGGTYLETIGRLDAEVRAAGTAWLESIGGKAEELLFAGAAAT
jgi:bifunctional UDP-N-acetylglucosamine pyrophosphorylase / glucosamine-1-phosphate N-acetyltransferase